MKYYYHILQTHHASTHAHARTHAHTHLFAHLHVHTGARMLAHAHAHTPRSPFRFDESVASKRDGVNAPFRLFLAFVAGRWVIQINTRAGDQISLRFCMFSRIKQLLGRTETQTRDRMCYQSMRTVWDISRDYRARIATYSLRTSTDRQT